MKKITSLIAALAMAMSLFTVSASASVSTDVTEVKAGQYVVATVQMPATCELLTSAELKLTYDKNVFSLEAVDSDLDSTTIEKTSIPTTNNYAWVCFQASDSAGDKIEKDVVLLRATFKVLDTAAIADSDLVLGQSEFYSTDEYEDWTAGNDMKGTKATVTVKGDEVVVEDPTHVNTVIGTFDSTTNPEITDGSTATAIKSEIFPNGNTINKITWAWNGVSKFVDITSETVLSGDATYVFGVVVPDAIEASALDVDIQ